MKRNTIIHRYILGEFVPPFFICTAFLMFIFFMVTLLDITDKVVNYRVGMGTVLKFILYSMPFFMQFVIPMAVMLAILLTLMQMSADNEIVALKAGGIGIYAILPPVAVFCMAGVLLTGVMTLYGLPWGRHSYLSLAGELNASNVTALISENKPNDSFKGIVLYVTRIDAQHNTLKGVFIEDRSTQNQVVTVTAPTGHLLPDSDPRVYHLELERGRINQTVIDKKNVNALTFDRFTQRLDLKRGLSGGRAKDEEEMSLSELKAYLRESTDKNKHYFHVLMEFHKKFALPLACLPLGLLAVPLGIRSKSAKRSFGIGLGLFFFLGYYLLLSAGQVFGESGIYPPLIGMWLPDLVMGGIGGFLLVRCAQERPIFPALPGWLLRKTPSGKGLPPNPATRDS